MTKPVRKNVCRAYLSKVCWRIKWCWAFVNRCKFELRPHGRQREQTGWIADDKRVDGIARIQRRMEMDFGPVVA